MITKNTSFFTTKQAQKSHNLLDAFIEFLDSVYWTGYAESIAESHPEKYNFEYELFLNTY